CETRLAAILEIRAMERVDITTAKAVSFVCQKFQISARSVYYWQELIDGLDREDWLAALAPSFASTAERSECHPEAWSFLKSDFLRPEAPAFTECYRRMVDAARIKEWTPIASERSLRRRLNGEVSRAVQTLARKGKDKAKALYPAQRRVRS